MPYDILIADSKSAATKQSPRLSLSEQVYDDIFAKNMHIKAHYPLIFSMSDYYRDCAYQYSSLENLKKEIQRINSDAQASINMKLFAKQLGEIIEEAVVQKHSIYCFCD